MKNFLKIWIAMALLISTCFAGEMNFYAGYEIVKVNKGWTTIGNNYVPSAGSNTLQFVYPVPADGSQLYKYDADTGLYDIAQYLNLTGLTGWNPNFTFNTGEGAILHSPSGPASPFLISNNVVVLAGELPAVQQVTVINIQPNKNFVLLSSRVPKTGRLQTDLGFPPRSGDAFYFPNPTNENAPTLTYTVYLYEAILGGWWPSEPVLKRNTAFWYRSLTTGQVVWNQTYITETNDGREFGVQSYPIWDDFINGWNINIWCEQRQGEELFIEYSLDEGATWSEFLHYTVLTTPTTQIVGGFWPARPNYEAGLLRARIVTP